MSVALWLGDRYDALIRDRVNVGVRVACMLNNFRLDGLSALRGLDARPSVIEADFDRKRMIENSVVHAVDNGERDLVRTDRGEIQGGGFALLRILGDVGEGGDPEFVFMRFNPVQRGFETAVRAAADVVVERHAPASILRVKVAANSVVTGEGRAGLVVVQ